MDTITCKLADGLTFDVPVVVAFGPDGKPVELVGDVTPENCNHAGETWSDCLDMRCPRCGSRLFLPVRLLAYLPETTIERMHTLWCAAGWPEFRGGGDNPGWRGSPDKWIMVDNLPDFDHVGGLAVRSDRLATFQAVTP